MSLRRLTRASIARPLRLLLVGGLLAATLAACSATAEPAPATPVPTDDPNAASALCISDGGGQPACGRVPGSWPAAVVGSPPPGAGGAASVERACAVLASLDGGGGDEPKLFLGASATNGDAAFPMPEGKVVCVAGDGGDPLGRAPILIAYQDGVIAKLHVRWWTPDLVEVAVTTASEVRWSGFVSGDSPASFPLGIHAIGLEVRPELDGTPTLHVTIGRT